MTADPPHHHAEDVVEALLAGISNGPSAALADLYAADAVVELPFARPGGLVLRGRPEIEAHFAAAGGGPLRLRVGRMELHRTLDPRTVVADYDYEVVATTTGRRARVANVQIVTVEAGRITRSRDFHDHAAMAALLGAADRAEGPSAGKRTSA